MKKTLAALAAATLAISGCKPSDEVSPPSEQPTSAVTSPTQQAAISALPAPFENLDPQDPDQVIEAAADNLWGFDPVHDTDHVDAARRTWPLLTQDMKDRLTGPEGAGIINQVPHWQFSQWKEGHIDVQTRARVQSDDHPEDTPSTHARVVEVDMASSDGYAWLFSVYVTAVREDGMWKVDRMNVASRLDILKEDRSSRPNIAYGAEIYTQPRSWKGGQ